MLFVSKNVSLLVSHIQYYGSSQMAAEVKKSCYPGESKNCQRFYVKFTNS